LVSASPGQRAPHPNEICESRPTDINTAFAEELMTVPGIGESVATKIVTVKTRESQGRRQVRQDGACKSGSTNSS